MLEFLPTNFQHFQHARYSSCWFC